MATFRSNRLKEPQLLFRPPSGHRFESGERLEAARREAQAWMRKRGVTPLCGSTDTLSKSTLSIDLPELARVSSSALTDTKLTQKELRRAIDL